MKFFSALFIFSLPAQLFASTYIRCSMVSSYEIYKGEGMVERNTGTPIALPVEFGFFTNGVAMTSGLTGEFSTINVKAVATEDEANVRLSGGAKGSSGFQAELVFHPRNGSEQNLTQGQLAAFNYTSPVNRVVFTRGTVKCLPAKNWDYRPVIAP